MIFKEKIKLNIKNNLSKFTILKIQKKSKTNIKSETKFQFKSYLKLNFCALEWSTAQFMTFF
jgi:hypothetical protein